MSAHNTGRRLAEKELSAWTRTREPGSPLLVSRSERHTQEEEEEGVQAVANAWTAVEGVMADRRISKRLRDTGPNYNNKGCKYAKTTGYDKLQE